MLLAIYKCLYLGRFGTKGTPYYSALPLCLLIRLRIAVCPLLSASSTGVQPLLSFTSEYKQIKYDCYFIPYTIIITIYSRRHNKVSVPFA